VTCVSLSTKVVLDLHCAPGSQNGFDNSGRKGEVHFDDSEKTQQGQGRTIYPNIVRALEVIANLTSHFSTDEFSGTVVGIELVNEAFVTIPIEVVKDYYLQGYEIVKQNGDTMAVIIGDSFRFGAWGDFMFPPHYRHVWIDTHIYQVFDLSRLSMTWSQHITQTCKLNKSEKKIARCRAVFWTLCCKNCSPDVCSVLHLSLLLRPEVAVAPLSTMVGEWSLATTDCAKWLNGYGSGARFDGTFPPGSGSEHTALGSCVGQEDIHNTTIWTQEYKGFLIEFSNKQMDAYESGSSEGWFFCQSIAQ
jgi:glucan 1,3-beta-glucosidase